LSHRRRQGDDEAWAKMQPITLDDLSAIQEQVLKVDVNERMDDLIEAVIERLYEEGVVVYGRRDVRLNPILQANALLEGRDEVNEADLVDVLPHTLWDNPDHRKLVRKVVLEIANPIGLLVQELLDEAKELRDEAISRKNPDGTDKDDAAYNRGGSEANAKLKKLISGDDASGIKGITQLFEGAKKSGFPTKQIENALQTVKRYQRDVAKEVMGFDI